ncbi:MAG: hypothetical protein WA208_20275 [Thermoanaerobaculia bacterium]
MNEQTTEAAGSFAHEHPTETSTQITPAQMIGWLASNLTSDVRGREDRRAALERAIGVVGRFVDAIGDDFPSVMADQFLEIVIGGRWEVEHPELSAGVRAHITLMERESGRRPTFATNGKTASRSRAVSARRGR